MTRDCDPDVDWCISVVQRYRNNYGDMSPNTQEDLYDFIMENMKTLQNKMQAMVLIDPTFTKKPNYIDFNKEAAKLATLINNYVIK